MMRAPDPDPRPGAWLVLCLVMTGIACAALLFLAASLPRIADALRVIGGAI